MSSLYEAPLDPVFVEDTNNESVDESVDRLLQFILDKLQRTKWL